MSVNIEGAVAEWRKIVGPENLIRNGPGMDEYASSVCGAVRSIPCVLRPASREEVVGIVGTANDFKIPLYPFSLGRNWGMGSRLPVRSECVLVDLGRMNRIVEVNVKEHYALIEPGVTQWQLYRHIVDNGLPLLFNVTGSSGGTSIIGNALDRGVGYFASRADSLSGIEVVLGSGRVVETGFRHFHAARTAAIYRHGVGPSLDGLFAQSNYGIVTSAYFELMPRQEDHMAVIAKIDSDDKLPAFIDALADLRRSGVIGTVAHVGNKARSEITLAPLVWEQLRLLGYDNHGDLKRLAVEMLAKEGFGPWSAVVGVLGTRGQLKFARRAIRRRLRGIAKTIVLTDRLVDFARRMLKTLSPIPCLRDKRVMLESVVPLYEITKGIPTDAPLKSVYWPAGDFESIDSPNPDVSASGMLYCLPILPVDGVTVHRVMSRTRELFSEYGFDAYITVNLMDARAMECVVSLGCDRNDSERMQAARRCIDEMEAEYVRDGYIPYRLGIDSMDCVLDDEDPFWQTTSDIKQVLDPNNIIAPKKYSLL